METKPSFVSVDLSLYIAMYELGANEKNQLSNTNESVGQLQESESKTR